MSTASVKRGVLRALEGVGFKSPSTIFELAEQGDCRAVRLLIESGGGTANDENEKGDRPLHCAVIKQRESVVEWLLGHGADMNAVNKKGSTALHIAAYHGNLALVRLLTGPENSPRNAKGQKGKTALHYAVQGKHIEVVRLLLRKRVDVTILNEASLTALDVAIAKEYQEIAELLTRALTVAAAAAPASDETAPGPLCPDPEEDGTELHAVAGEGNARRCRELYSEAAHPHSLLNRPDQAGNTPLHYAAGRGRLEACRTLCTLGASETGNLVGHMPSELATSNAVTEYLLSTKRMVQALSPLCTAQRVLAAHRLAQDTRRLMQQQHEGAALSVRAAKDSLSKALTALARTQRHIQDGRLAVSEDTARMRDDQRRECVAAHERLVAVHREKAALDKQEIERRLAPVEDLLRAAQQLRSAWRGSEAQGEAVPDEESSREERLEVLGAWEPFFSQQASAQGNALFADLAGGTGGLAAAQSLSRLCSAFDGFGPEEVAAQSVVAVAVALLEEQQASLDEEHTAICDAGALIASERDFVSSLEAYIGQPAPGLERLQAQARKTQEERNTLDYANGQLLCLCSEPDPAAARQKQRLQLDSYHSARHELFALLARVDAQANQHFPELLRCLAWDGDEQPEWALFEQFEAGITLGKYGPLRDVSTTAPRPGDPDVFSTEVNITGERCTLKRYATDPTTGKVSPAFFREQEALQLSHHTNVVQLNRFFIDGDKFFLELPAFEGGTLADWADGKRSEADYWTRVQLVLHGLLHGLAHLHALHIAHTAVCPETIMMQGDTPVLSGLEHSRRLQQPLDDDDTGSPLESDVFADDAASTAASTGPPDGAARSRHDSQPPTRAADVAAVGVVAQFLDGRSNSDEGLCELAERLSTTPHLSAKAALREPYFDSVLDKNAPTEPTTRACRVYKQLAARKAEIFDRVPASSWQPKYDCCFCGACCDSRGEPDTHATGADYRVTAVPRHWVKFAVGATKAEKNNAYKDWNQGYHGTRKNLLASIIKTEALCIPGEHVVSNEPVASHEGHLSGPTDRINETTGERERFDPGQHIFLSPSIQYASHEQHYAKSFSLNPPLNGSRSAKLALQVRIKPGTFATGQQTVLEATSGVAQERLDPRIPNAELEWYTSTSKCHAITGVLLRLV